MSNPTPPLFPHDDDPEVATRDVDGEAVIDEDTNDDLVNSADADRIVTLEPDDED